MTACLNCKLFLRANPSDIMHGDGKDLQNNLGSAHHRRSEQRYNDVRKIINTTNHSDTLRVEKIFLRCTVTL